MICKFISHGFVIKKHPCLVFYPEHRCAASALTQLQHFMMRTIQAFQAKHTTCLDFTCTKKFSTTNLFLQNIISIVSSASTKMINTFIKHVENLKSRPHFADSRQAFETWCPTSSLKGNCWTIHNSEHSSCLFTNLFVMTHFHSCVEQPNKRHRVL